jgi:hypothetical protein
MKRRNNGGGGKYGGVSLINNRENESVMSA